MSAESQLPLPVRAYVDPIRSVLFIDDQFPTYADPESGREHLRARALWSACRARGWLCDVDNVDDWSTPEQRKRLASSDLIVLDYHLAGSDPTPALNIIASLAASPLPDLVVVYTSESDLNMVLNHVAAFARGVDETLLSRDLGEVADLEGEIAWSDAALRAYMSGGDSWVADFAASCSSQSPALDHRAHFDSGRSLVEKHLKSAFQGPPTAQPRRIESIGSTGTAIWLQCGNLFVAIVRKPSDEGEQHEADTLLGGLEAAVEAWAPPWLACLVALSRREITDGAFRDDLILPNNHLQNGLLHYVSTDNDAEEKARRSRQVAADLLRRRFHAACNHLGTQVLNHASTAEKPDQLALLHVNAFLCAERHERHHLRVGTVYRSEDSTRYWACVTPACDMVPRQRNEKLDPWGASLGQNRAMTAVRLTKVADDKISKALKEAHRGRYLFFEDFSVNTGIPLVFSGFTLSTDDPNPHVEQMFARNLARKDENGKVDVELLVEEDGVIKSRQLTCVVVCQLRAPYAERLTHIVGGHVSRIGVDFIST